MICGAFKKGKVYSSHINVKSEGRALPVIDCLADLLRHGAALLLLHCAALLPVDSAALLLIDGGALLLVHSAALLLSCGPTLLLINCKRNILLVYLFCSIPSIGFMSEVFNQSDRHIVIF